ncbi:MAG: flagellar hook-associated protein FlgK [Desulfobacterales bacterium]|nr:flagellar hook-associated protein FlgK [Desulfobacterales bacterium]
MGGLNQTLSIAKSAISINQYSLAIAGNNIANVNTPSYSRQTVISSTKTYLSMGDFRIGTGVDIDEVQRSYNTAVEERLINQKSQYKAYEEMDNYMTSVEGLFNENSEGSLSNRISEMWGSWQDLSNNPAGTPERQQVYSTASSMVDQFDSLSYNLRKKEVDLSKEIESGVSDINNIADEIAALNKEIVAVESMNPANDLRDKRNALMSELSGYINVNSFELSNGSLTVNVANGYSLISGVSTYDLSVSQGQVNWQGSGGKTVDITDKISSGKIGGWLEMRDSFIPQYRNNLDSLAKEITWSINQQHSQGVGLEFFDTAVTGTYETDSTGLFMTLPFADKVDYTKDFKMWVEDTSGATPVYNDITFNMATGASVPSATMNPTGRANSVNDTYKFVVSPAGSSIGGAAAVDVTWTNSITSGTFSVGAAPAFPVNATVDGMNLQFAGASGPFTGDTFTIQTDSSGTPTENVSNYTLADFVTQFQTANDAVFGAGNGITASVTNNKITFTPSSGSYNFAFGDDGSSGFSDSGTAAALGLNTFFTGNDADSIGINGVINDLDKITAGRIDGNTGEAAWGDNSNTLIIDEFQYQILNISQWSFVRGNDAVSTAISATKEDYYQKMIGSIGIDLRSISREMDFNEVMVSTIENLRDSISAVSLDEEMINLMKYQQGFSVASKLLSVADEMMQTLISST